MLKSKYLIFFLSVCILFECGFCLSARAEKLKLLILGDSLTAGYGLLPEEALPSQLQRKLKMMGYSVEVLNGGVSGDTSAGGRSRLNWALADKPDAVILALGANDGLRGLDSQDLRKNLDAIITVLRVNNIAVLLAGMRAPPNFGPLYTAEFNAVYPFLAQKHDILFFPFFLKGVAAVPELNQKDGIHPNKKGVRVILDHMVSYVTRLIESVRKNK